MKRKRILTALLAVSVLGFASSCNRASKYADDVVKYADDKIDDYLHGGKSIKPKPKPKRCSSCNGTGYVHDVYYNRYQCSNCGGDGIVYLNF